MRARDAPPGAVRSAAAASMAPGRPDPRRLKSARAAFGGGEATESGTHLLRDGFDLVVMPTYARHPRRSAPRRPLRILTLTQTAAGSLHRPCSTTRTSPRPRSRPASRATGFLLTAARRATEGEGVLLSVGRQARARATGLRTSRRLRSERGELLELADVARGGRTAAGGVRLAWRLEVEAKSTPTRLGPKGGEELTIGGIPTARPDDGFLGGGL